MKIRFFKPRNVNKRIKLTVHRTGKLGFSKDASQLLNLEKNKFCKFGTNENSDLLFVICKEGDNTTFSISKAGDYYYVNAKSLLKDLDIDYKDENTYIFDIEDIDKEDIYKLKKRVIMKE